MPAPIIRTWRSLKVEGDIVMNNSYCLPRKSRELKVKENTIQIVVVLAYMQELKSPRSSRTPRPRGQSGRAKNSLLQSILTTYPERLDHSCNGLRCICKGRSWRKAQSAAFA